MNASSGLEASCARSIEEAVLELFQLDPFFAHIALRLPRIVDRSIPTASVGTSGLNIVLRVNPEFWLGLKSSKLRVGVLKHELLHIVLDHIVRQTSFDNRPLFNIAADLAINDTYIGSDNLPADALLVKDFEMTGIEVGDSTELIYNTLEEFMELDLQGFNDEQQEVSSCQNRIKELLSQDRHKEWDVIGDDQSRREVQRGVQQVLVSALEEHGSQFEEDSEIRDAISIAAVRGKSSVDWRRVIKIFGCSSRRTSVMNTMKRVSRRFGTAPGTRIKKRTSLMVIIDTSGSIGPVELSRFLAEVNGIWRAGAEIELVEADNKVRRTSKYRGQDIDQLQGGGGTDFDPAITYASSRQMLDGVIYLTDGLGSLSVTSRRPVLWVIIADGIDEDSDMWKQMSVGRNRIIKMTPNESA